MRLRDELVPQVYVAIECPTEPTTTKATMLNPDMTKHLRLKYLVICVCVHSVTTKKIVIDKSNMFCLNTFR